MATVVGLVDTTILVDILRGYTPSVTWIQTQSALAITPVVWMELTIGAPNKARQIHARKLLSQFQTVFLTEADQKWAMRQLLAHTLRHGVGILDCLIAAPTHRLQVPLYTTNLKHFQPILGTLVQKPY